MNQLNPAQAARLERLEEKLRFASLAGDYKSAKMIIVDIQNILSKTSDSNRLLRSKALLYEAALEDGSIDDVIRAIPIIRNKCKSTTKLYLELTVILSIAYIRNDDLASAEIHIRESIQLAGKNIASPEKIKEFRRDLIERYQSEGILFSIRDQLAQKLSPSELEERLRIENNDNYNLSSLGRLLPDSSLQIAHRIERAATSGLLTYEREYLVAPSTDEEKGRKLFSALNRVVWSSLCDPKNEMHKVIHKNGIDVLLDKKFIAGSVATAFGMANIPYLGMAALFTGISLKMGIKYYCVNYRPLTIMEKRGKHAT